MPPTTPPRIRSGGASAQSTARAMASSARECSGARRPACSASRNTGRSMTRASARAPPSDKRAPSVDTASQLAALQRRLQHMGEEAENIPTSTRARLPRCRPESTTSQSTGRRETLWNCRVHSLFTSQQTHREQEACRIFGVRQESRFHNLMAWMVLDDRLGVNSLTRSD